MPAVLLAVSTAALKAATGWWSARHAGLGARARLRVATTLVPRGEFSIVIAGLAVGAGVDASLGALAAAYVLFTMVAGPFLARIPDAAWFTRFSKRRQQARRARAAGAVAAG